LTKIKTQGGNDENKKNQQKTLFEQKDHCQPARSGNG
jgi:hypothetical protein